MGIEYYLNNKYDEPDRRRTEAVMPKVSSAKKNAFAEANAKKRRRRKRLRPSEPNEGVEK